MKHPIAQTRNGIPVYVDLIYSRAATNIAQQPHLLVLLKELLGQTKIGGSKLSFDKDMGRSIGNTYIVETSGKDTILYAQRIRDNVYTRFVKNSAPLPTQHIAVVLSRDDEGNYELQDTWIGRLFPPMPGSSNETTDSKPYWLNHAFVFNGESIQTRTITRECPY